MFVSFYYNVVFRNGYQNGSAILLLNPLLLLLHLPLPIHLYALSKMEGICWFRKSIIISKCECLLFSNMLAVPRILYCRFMEMVSIFEDNETSQQQMLMFVVNGGNMKLNRSAQSVVHIQKRMFSELHQPGGTAHFTRYTLHSIFPMYIQNLNVYERIRSNTFMFWMVICIHASCTKILNFSWPKIPSANSVQALYSKF